MLPCERQHRIRLTIHLLQFCILHHLVVPVYDVVDLLWCFLVLLLLCKHLRVLSFQLLRILVAEQRLPLDEALLDEELRRWLRQLLLLLLVLRVTLNCHGQLVLHIL